MNNSLLRLLALSAAVSIPTDAAYVLLHQEYIDGFRKEYEEQCDNKQISVIDAFIGYTLKVLPMERPECQSVVFQLVNDRDLIVERFVTSNVAQLVTKLANREVVLEAVRDFMRKENNIKSAYSKVHSNRMQTVFTMFMSMFEESCAWAFRFEGNFLYFVMNCFIKYFYKPRKMDVWNALCETDSARKEAEFSLVQEKNITVVRTDDLPIHELVVNISEADDLLFYHAGQQTEVRGVVYDLYYLILCYLCEQKVEAMNKELTRLTLEFVDPWDYKVARNNLDANKGVSAKIINAKDLVPEIFEHVRSGKLSASELSGLRDKCFSLGKCDREGRNCVWKDVSLNGETSRYLDNAASAANYDAFDKILKGVISTYTLIKESEARGIDLIGTYNPELFRDKNIVRYIDYLSSVPYIDLIHKLQVEDKDGRNHGELLKFPDMVDEYAGSKENNHNNIKENRYYALTRGLLVNPKLKQKVGYRTAYEQLQSVANCFTATPRSYLEYFEERAKGVLVDGEETECPWFPMFVNDVIAGHYKSLNHNIFITQMPETARHYLLSVASATKPLHNVQIMQNPANDVLPTVGSSKDGQGQEQSLMPCERKGSEVLQDLTWRVGTSNIEGVVFNRVYFLFVPAVRRFIAYGTKNQDVNASVTATLEEIMSEVNQSSGRPGKAIPFSTCYLPVELAGHLAGEKRKRKLEESMDFSSYIGINNLTSAGSLAKLEALNVHPEYKKLVGKYYDWKQELGRMQQSMIQILQSIFTYAIYLSDRSVPVGAAEHIKGDVMLDCLCKKEFDSETLNWFLEELNSKKMLVTIDLHENSSSYYTAIDRQALWVAYNTLPDEPEEDSLLKEFMGSVSEEKDPATRFILYYNMLATRIYFLRMLGDAYALLFTVAVHDISSLNCELNHRFKIKEKLSKFHEEAGSIGASIDTREAGSLRHSSWLVRDNCVKEFIVLLEQLGTYLSKCEQEISDLVDYNITSNKEVVSRFSSFGSTFDILPTVPDTEVMQKVRAQATTDTAGFFLYNGTYFKGQNGSSTYYVHRTGRMLVDNGKCLKAASFKLSDPAQLKLYNAILTWGLRNEPV